MAICPRGSWVALGGSRGTVHVLDAKTSASVALFEGAGGCVADLAWSADGRRLGAGAFPEGSCNSACGVGIPSRASWTVWDVDRRAILLRAQSSKPARDLHGLALNADGSALATWGCDADVQEYRIDGGEHPLVPSPRSGTIAAWQPNGRRLLTGDGDGTLRVYDSASGREEARARFVQRAVRCLAISDDGTTAMAGTNAAHLAAISLPGLQVRWSRTVDVFFRTDEDFVACIDIAPDGQRAIVGTGTWYETELVSIGTGESLWNTEPGNGCVEIMQLAISPDSRSCIRWGLHRGSLTFPGHALLDLETGAVKRVLDALEIDIGPGSAGWTADAGLLLLRLDSRPHALVLDGKDYRTLRELPIRGAPVREK